MAALVCGAAAGQTVSGDRGSSALASTDSRTMVVTSDSGAYCHTLSGAIDAHGTLSREVKELKAQGEGLCDEGQIRSGINRLRRALLVLMHKDAPQGVPAQP